MSPITADLSGRPTTKKPNVTHPLQPSIAGLDLSALSTSTVSNSSNSLTTKKPQTLVVIHKKPSTPQTQNSVGNSTVKYQPDEIPVEIIIEPVLKPKTRQSSQSAKRKLANRQVSGQRGDSDDVRIRPRRAQMVERMRLRRAQSQNRLVRNGNSDGCNRGEIRDGQGGCRVRRSGMSGLLGFLTRFLPQRDRK